MIVFDFDRIQLTIFLKLSRVEQESFFVLMKQLNNMESIRYKFLKVRLQSFESDQELRYLFHYTEDGSTSGLGQSGTSTCQWGYSGSSCGTSRNLDLQRQIFQFKNISLADLTFDMLLKRITYETI